uniref:MULE transposase domain-containing protein n=1 Tax=Lactuca sativa TaxID=4236 RepID=A0A9R1UFY3_LACSA|nr:hypothetical protein LSAT_V11C900467960 [Lactuca sativa]
MELYNDPDRQLVRDVDFSAFEYEELMEFLQKLTRSRSKDIYFCLPQESLSQGIHTLVNDGDYKEFSDLAYANERRMNCSCEEDDDSVLLDIYFVDHEEDDVECPFSANKTMGDRFLNKLCLHIVTVYVEPQYPVHDDRQPWNQMKPLLGINYATANGYDLWFEKNDSQRLLLKCCKKNKSPTCPFRLWASWMSKEKTFQIKSLVSEHNCSRVFTFGSIVMYKWLGKQFMSEIIEKPKMSVRKMKAKVSTTFNINLWSYGHEILRTNPGSTVRMDVDIMPYSTTLFSNYYVCFKVVSDGWKEGCRPVMGLDGFFSKGIVKGEVLAAVGRDANNHIYPIAWAVVGVENKATRKWFIDLLMDDIDGGLGAGITFLSDGQKGLLEAVKERCPEAEHRQCVRHIVANFSKRFTGQHFRKLFWRAVKASTEQKFKHTEILLPGLTHFFKKGGDCDAVENGVSESFNSAIRHARRKPIITMLEEIRIFVMEMIYKGNEWDLTICPSIRKLIQDLKIVGVTPCGYQKYEVRIWKLIGIPCLHGVAAISSLNQDAETYVSQSYSKEAYLKCYNYSIKPFNGSDMWLDVPYQNYLPPKRRRLPGRSSAKRKSDVVERELSGPVRHSVTRRGALIRCSICMEPGHNMKKCLSKQQTNTSAPSSSRGSGAGPSQPPPPPPAQPPQPPPAPPTTSTTTTNSSCKAYPKKGPNWQKWTEAIF